MKRSIPLLALLAIMPVGVSATPVFDEDVTPDVIFGTGNANGGFTVDRDNDVELGLRAKLRHNAAGQPENTFNSNGDGTYSFDAGVAPGQSFPTAIWSFEWSINAAVSGQTDRVLNQLNYELGIDSDPGAGTTFTTSDPINTIYEDHAIGNNTTGNGNGTVAGGILGVFQYQLLIAGNNVAQNSQKAHWGIDDFDPTVDGTYDFYLSASDDDGVLARTEMQVIVGDGAAADDDNTGTVPVPAPLALFGLGLFALGFARRTRKA